MSTQTGCAQDIALMMKGCSQRCRKGTCGEDSSWQGTKPAAELKVEVLGGVYVKSKKVAADFFEKMRIVFDAHLRRWNYRAVPTNG